MTHPLSALVSDVRLPRFVRVRQKFPTDHIAPETLPDAIRQQLREAVALRAGARVRTALTQLQVWRADCLGLGARAGLTAPAKWSALRGDWPREFARQEPTVELWAELWAELRD